MADIIAHKVLELPTSNIDEGGIYYLYTNNQIHIYLRVNSAWKEVGKVSVDKVNGHTGDVELDLDFTSGKLKITSTGDGVATVTSEINLDTRFEQISNKVQDLANPNEVDYPSTIAVEDAINAFFKNLYEEQIPGRRLTITNVDYALTLDWNDYKVFDITLSGDSTLADSNLPNGIYSKVIEIIITGDHSLTLPTYWKPFPNNDPYDGTKLNHIVVTCIDGGTNKKVLYSLNNLPIGTFN